MLNIRKSIFSYIGAVVLVIGALFGFIAIVVDRWTSAASGLSHVGVYETCFGSECFQMTRPNTMALERIMGVPVGSLGMSYNRMLAVAGLMTTGVILTSFAAVAMLVITFLQLERPIFHFVPPILSLPSALFFLVAFSVWASVHADVYAKANPLVYDSNLGASFGLAIMAFIITTVGGSAASYLAYITYRSYTSAVPTPVPEGVAVPSSESVPGKVSGQDVRVDMVPDASPFVIADEESVGPHDSREYLRQAPGVVTPTVPVPPPQKLPTPIVTTSTSRSGPGTTADTASLPVSPSEGPGDEIYKTSPTAAAGDISPIHDTPTKVHSGMDIPEREQVAASASTTSAHRRVMDNV